MRKERPVTPAMRAAVRLLSNGWKLRTHYGTAGMSPDTRYLYRIERRKDRKPKMLYRKINPSTFNSMLSRKMITTDKIHRSAGLVSGRTYRATHSAMYPKN